MTAVLVLNSRDSRAAVLHMNNMTRAHYYCMIPAPGGHSSSDATFCKPYVIDDSIVLREHCQHGTSGRCDANAAVLLFTTVIRSVTPVVGSGCAETGCKMLPVHEVPEVFSLGNTYYGGP